MSGKDREDAWDFTSVVDLIHSLSSKADRCAASDTSLGFSSEEPITPELDEVGEQDGDHGELGNFDKLWKYLGQPLNVPPPTLTPRPIEALDKILVGNDELVDDALDPRILKGVKWRDEVEGADLADNDENYNPSSLPKLSKARKKKLRMKKNAQAKKGGLSPAPALGTTSSENESEVEPRETTPSKSRGSVIRDILYGSRPEAEGTPSLSTPTREAEALKWPISNPRYFLRSSVQTPEASSQEPQASVSEIASRKSTLIKKLQAQFIPDRPYLENVSIIAGRATGDPESDDGIHVFVDASNILIGFHDALKLSRGLSINARIRRQPLSFDNLSLILERGRPASKRILVGSDNFPSILEAKTIGYETNILDRVHKAKELTPRQKRYSNASTGAAASGSGSETTAAVMYAPEKWVEQAVDEILHLKILESVVDAHEPSTIVLATGDAAEAEYSQGFLKMVERAMMKGWLVELCSFRRNISGAYRKKEFRERWGHRFKIIEMDRFVEELLGVES